MIARLLLALAVTVALAGFAQRDVRAANSIEVTSVDLEPADEGRGWLLSADFYLPLSTRIRDVLDLGIPLHFVVEFEVTSSRWYWTDEKIAAEQQNYRLSYHPVTRRFRLTRSGYPQEFVELDDALASLARVRGWHVLADRDLDADETYDAALRLRLDASRLPGPLQIDALTNQDWNLDAQWKRFTLTPGTPTRSP